MWQYDDGAFEAADCRHYSEIISGVEVGC